MVLSIGMIVKNEEKYLEECLTALQPILTELDSELIITDTGSTDRTVEIAKKFTDNVLYFEWINDFAAARNTTIEKAQGEWYMFIDADEIAEDCTELIKFFKSGEYRKFNSANIIIRSLISANDKTNYSDIRLSRLVRRLPITKFVNPIHEVLSPVAKPIKYLDFDVLHYGYTFGGEGGKELAEQKSQRNLELLLEEFNNTDIDKMRSTLCSLIADSYKALGDFEGAMKYLDIGLEHVSHRSVDIVMYYSRKIEILVLMKKYSELIEVSDEYFDIEKNPFHTKDHATDCYIRNLRGYAYHKMGNNRGAIQEMTKFFDLYGKYCKGRLNTPDLLTSQWKVYDDMVKEAYNIFFDSCEKEKQYELANQYTRTVPLEKFCSDPNFMAKHIHTRLVILGEVGYDGLDELYRQLDDYGKNYLMRALRLMAPRFAPHNREILMKKMSVLGGMPSELAQIYEGYFNGAADFRLIQSFLLNYGSENSEDLLYILLENQMDISPFLHAYDYAAGKTVETLFDYFPHTKELLENYDIKQVSDEALKKATSFYGTVLRRKDIMLVTSLFEKYAALGKRWYDTFGDSAEMSMDVQTAYLSNGLVEAVNSGDRARFTAAMNALKSAVPKLLIPFVDTYEQENEYFLKTVSVNPEFEQLAAQVKDNIRRMTMLGNISDARALLREFEGLCPGDPDIEALRSEINNTLQ